MIHLIRCDVHERADARRPAHALQDMYRPHDVRGVCPDGIAITFEDARLCREMNDDLRAGDLERPLERVKISYIARNAFHPRGNPGGF